MISRLENLKSKEGINLQLEKYGQLSFDPEKYPLYAVKVGNVWDNSKPSLLVTGGVHGYETSGVSGAIKFLENHAAEYSEYMNIAVLPCISPLAYELLCRWNNQAIDINREFHDAATAEEAILAMEYIKSLNTHFEVAVDLHETTDSDPKTFRVEKALRDGETKQPNTYVPNGYYLIADKNNKAPQLSQKIITDVGQVTAIANDKEIMDLPNNGGLVEVKIAGICMSFCIAHANNAFTTEVYPNSITLEEAEAGQVATIKAAAEYIKDLHYN